jgi:hypothetical protein
MVGELERCERCHRRYPAAFEHRCPLTSLGELPGEELEREFREWLETNAGRFAQYLAVR